MADRDVIKRFYAVVGVERFYAVVGVGTVDGPIKHIRKNDGKRLKDVFAWRTNSWHVIKDLYALFMPWLGTRRRAQFDHALSVGRPKSMHRRRTAKRRDRAVTERVEFC